MRTATQFTPARAARARIIRKAYADNRLEAFAEAISDLNTVRAASAYVGISERTGERYMRQLCAEAGR